MRAGLHPLPKRLTKDPRTDSSGFFMPKIMKYQHTPGPWAIERFYTEDQIMGEMVILCSNGRPIAKTNHSLISKNLPPAEILANARLIAAAPDLLAALKQVLATGFNGGNNVRLCLIAAGQKALSKEELDRAEFSEMAVQNARAAIAKAETV